MRSSTRRARCRTRPCTDRAAAGSAPPRVAPEQHGSPPAGPGNAAPGDPESGSDSVPRPPAPIRRNRIQSRSRTPRALSSIPRRDRPGNPHAVRGRPRRRRALGVRLPKRGRRQPAPAGASGEHVPHGNRAASRPRCRGPHGSRTEGARPEKPKRSAGLWRVAISADRSVGGSDPSFRSPAAGHDLDVTAVRSGDGAAGWRSETASTRTASPSSGDPFSWIEARGCPLPARRPRRRGSTSCRDRTGTEPTTPRFASH